MKNKLLVATKISLWTLSLPGIFVTGFAGLGVANLLHDEFYPDPSNIAHGMAMAHAFVPAVFWTIIGLAYLLALWLIWVLIKFLVRKRTG